MSGRDDLTMSERDGLTTSEGQDLPIGTDVVESRNKIDVLESIQNDINDIEEFLSQVDSLRRKVAQVRCRLNIYAQVVRSYRIT